MSARIRLWTVWVRRLEEGVVDFEAVVSREPRYIVPCKLLVECKPQSYLEIREEQ
jgi:hypothetical protein